MTGNNPKLDLMLMHNKRLVRFCQFVFKVLSGNEILTSIKGQTLSKVLQKKKKKKKKKWKATIPSWSLSVLMCIQMLVRFCQLVLKILSGNDILTSIKGRNCVKILQKRRATSPSQILSMLMCIQNLVRFCQFDLQILSGNEILT